MTWLEQVRTAVAVSVEAISTTVVTVTGTWTKGHFICADEEVQQRTAILCAVQTLIILSTVGAMIGMTRRKEPTRPSKTELRSRMDQRGCAPTKSRRRG